MTFRPGVHLRRGVKSIYPLCFWKVRDQEPEAHILGSIHYVSPGTFPLPEHIEKVITRAELALFEGKTTSATTSRLTFLKNRFHGPISDHLAGHPQVFARLRKAATKHGVDLTELDDYSLWFVAYSIHDASMERLGRPMSEGVVATFVVVAKIGWVSTPWKPEMR